MPKRTYQPKKRRRIRKHGFRNRSSNELKNKRRKGKNSLSASDEFRKKRKVFKKKK